MHLRGRTDSLSDGEQSPTAGPGCRMSASLHSPRLRRSVAALRTHVLLHVSSPIVGPVRAYFGDREPIPATIP